MIKKAELTDSTIRVQLKNGVEVFFSFNEYEPYIHVGFSFIDGGITAGAFHGHPEMHSVQLSNFVDISYQPIKD